MKRVDTHWPNVSSGQLPARQALSIGPAGSTAAGSTAPGPNQVSNPALSESELAEIEARYPDGLSTQEIVDFFVARGERLSDGAQLQLANAVPAGGGFDAVNPADGSRYQVRPNQLTISSSRATESDPALEYGPS